MFKTDSYYDNGWLYCDYSDRVVMDSGQTIKIEFNEEWSKSKYYYNIYLVTMDKRKTEKNTYLKSMGKDGLKGLIWAKQKIIEFESFIKEKHEGIPIVIYCVWNDNRRRNVYERGLRELGYKYNMIFGKKALSKTI